MFEALARAIDDLDVEAGTDALATLLALRDRLDAHISGAVAAADAAHLWDAEGATSMTAWLADRGRMARPRAGATARQARLVARLPRTAAAWADGRVSTGQVEAICANLDSEAVDLFADHEAAVLPALLPLSATDVGAAMRAWRAHTDPPPAPERPHTLHASRLLHGHLALKGTLDAETSELVLTALRLATTPDTAGEVPRSPATRRADALADVCRFFLDNQHTHTGGRHRPHLNVVLDLDRHGDVDQAQTTGGDPIGSISAGRLLCDSTLHRVITRGRSAILDYGHGTRTIPAPLWFGLVIRDQRCRFPGCDRPTHWCEAHHVTPWQHGGPTRLTNLVMLCTRHHHLLHKPGWEAKLLPDATFEVTDPRCHTRTTRPPATGPPRATPRGAYPSTSSAAMSAPA